MTGRFTELDESAKQRRKCVSLLVERVGQTASFLQLDADTSSDVAHRASAAFALLLEHIDNAEPRAELVPQNPAKIDEVSERNAARKHDYNIDMSTDAAQYDPRYLAGIVLFNRGDFSQATEVW